MLQGFSQPSHGILSQAFQSGSTTHQVAPLALLTAALSRPQIYGDERDGIIAKLNHLQAYWGTGKGFYNQQGVVDFTPQNPFCRFKVSLVKIILEHNRLLSLLKCTFNYIIKNYASSIGFPIFGLVKRSRFNYQLTMLL